MTLRRSTFKRQPMPKRKAPQIKPLTRPVVVADAYRMTVAVPKTAYVRSKPLMEAYRLIPCQHCGRDDGTVCGAHSNWAEHGKGRSIKASDNYAASLCFECHSWLDQGKALEKVKRAMWDAAHRLTVLELLRRQLWPMGVPVPELEGVEA